MSARAAPGELALLADGTGRGSGWQVLSQFAFGFRAGSLPVAR